MYVHFHGAVSVCVDYMGPCGLSIANQVCIMLAIAIFERIAISSQILCLFTRYVTHICM